MTEYKFTKDWFNWAPPVWEQLTPMLSGEAGSRNFLEIGSFEGRSTVWTLENMMQDGDFIHCIDTWEGGEEHSAENMSEVEERFDRNIAAAIMKYSNAMGSRRWVEKYKGASVQQLAHWLVEAPENHAFFDFIYIDGSHIAKDVMTDACMAWPLLKIEGLMVFDDYMWGNPRDALHRLSLIHI